MIITENSPKVSNPPPPAPHRSIADLLAPLEKIAIESSNLVIAHDAKFKSGDEIYELPRYIFVGPQGGDTPIHVGIFAGIHGDEPEGSHAIIQFVKMLEAKPELATGYCLTFYPICNPTGFEDGTRFSRNGKDLNSEFWTNSSEPEVRLLQAELISRRFRGIISLHTDGTSTDFLSYSCRTSLAKYLLKRVSEPVKDLKPAKGALSAPPRARPRPFDISLRCSAGQPSYLKEMAFIACLLMILTEYREFIAHAPNL